jgi:predicted transcriptional regulator
LRGAEISKGEQMAEAALKAESNPKKLRANEKKWGLELVDAGWTMVPSTILECQHLLGLDSVDLNILLQIAKHWWKADDPPWPSIKSIAERIGKSPSTIQRRITKLNKSGLIEIKHRFHERHKGQKSSIYTFDGLIAKATELARALKQEREESKSAKKALMARTILRAKRGLRVAPGTGDTEK